MLEHLEASLWLLCGEYTAEAEVEAATVGVLMAWSRVAAGEGVKSDQI